jgi:Protein of unknown function (DUF2934)
MSSARKLSEGERLNELVADGEISARAFQLWQERGCPQNDSDTDWFNARCQLLSETTLRNAMAETPVRATQETPPQPKRAPKLTDKPAPPSSRRRQTFPKGHSPIY